METLIKILEKIGENLARVGWMYGVPMYPRPTWYPRPPTEDR